MCRQDSQGASQRPLRAAGSCSPVACEGEPEFRKLTPRMHLNSKLEAHQRLGGF